MLEKKDYQILISSEHKLLDLHIKDTLAYKDLIFLFVKRDFVSQYKQTILGPLWALINPLMSTIVFTVIFGELAGLTTADIAGGYVIPAFLFYMSGNICWALFSGILSATSNTFISNSGIMGKVYYPRLVTPIATSFSCLISFGIQFVMFLAFWAYFLIVGGTSLCITPAILAVPLTILEMMMLGLGFGTIISSLTTKYRDLRMLVSFGLSLWRYATPIAFGLTLFTSKLGSFSWIFLVNPMTPIVTLFRYAMFGFGYFNWTYYLISWGLTLIIFFTGLIMFNKIERTFMDTI